MQKLLRQDLDQVDFEGRGFRLGPPRARLESAGRSFLTGFNLVVDGRTEEIPDVISAEEDGFAYEGAGMACALLDLLTLSTGRRLRALLAGPAADYPHLVHVGAGWAFARVRLRPWWGTITAPDPLLRWLAWDGFGFHQGFFRTEWASERRGTERWLTTAQRSIRDQGLGRSLWFQECADVDSIAQRIATFEPGRQNDLWSGAGLAATYAGGADPADLDRLVSHADGHRAHLAQGSAFACAARLRSGVLPEHTRDAAPVLTGADAEAAGAWTDRALETLGRDPHSAEHYQRWRAEIRRNWATDRRRV